MTELETMQRAKMYMEKLATIQRLLVKCGFHELKLKEKFD